MKRKAFRIFGLTLMLALLFASACMADGSELIVNGSFDIVDDQGMPAGWKTEAYRTMAGYTVFDLSYDGEEESNSAYIYNIGENDARFVQSVEVEPESLYCLSGWIKTEDIPDGGHGANLSVTDVYSFSEGLYGTNDWTYVELFGETGPDQTEIKVCARVGGYSGESLGKAWFDDVSLCKVDRLPDNIVADVWYTPVYQEQNTDAIDDNETERSPFWPWLVLMAAVYAVICMVTKRYVTDDHQLDESNEKTPSLFVISLILSFFVQIAIGLAVSGYQVDVSCFTAWGNTMANVGAMNFYEATNFCDYPPAYVYILGLNGIIAGLFGTGTTVFGLQSRAVQILIYKLIPILCNAVIAWLVYDIAKEYGCRKKQASALGALMAFNPALILNSSAWAQMDSVLCLLLMLVAVFAIRKQWKIVMPVYMISALVKPQALMLGFLGLLAIVIEAVRNPKARKDMLIGTGLAVAAALIILIPFSIHQDWDWLIKLYSSTLASYPYATVNTANYYYLFGGNWSSINNSAHVLAPFVLSLMCFGWSAFLVYNRKKKDYLIIEAVLMAGFGIAFAVLGIIGTTWNILGIAAMVLAFAVVLPMYYRSGKLIHLPLCGGILFILLYVIGIKMHERYLFPALVFLAMAYAIQKDKRILIMLLVSSCTIFINEGIVLDNSLRLGSSMGHLNQDTYALNMILSLLNVGLIPLAMWTGFDLCILGREKISEQSSIIKLQPVNKPDRSQDPSLHWKKLDWFIMLTVTIIYSAVVLCNLGSTKAPQSSWVSTGYDEQVVLDLGQSKDFYTLYFAQVSYTDFSIAVSDDGINWSNEQWAQMDQGQCYRWKYACDYSDSGAARSYTSTPHRFSGRYIRISAQQVGLYLNEVLFRDANDFDYNGEFLTASVVSRTGENIDSPLLSDPQNLLDEQDTLEGQPGWYNSTYFDEIYHARTAYEHLHGQAPYETTHPPLGKLLMSVCIAIFGMTPFGWRFAGAFMGILMLPAMYLIGKQLTKQTWLAFLSMMLMTLDCMHFTQTRIATIDSFPVLFILFAYFFMLRFMQMDLLKSDIRKLLTNLLLSGFFMGLAIASKWIGMYAGAGLAVLYFWMCLRCWCAAVRGETSDELLNQKSKDERVKIAGKRILTLCAWCVLFFVLIPAVIYLLCYIPYFAYKRIDSLSDFLENVINAQIGMFNYHSTPGLGMDHPFYSPWYEWPLIKRPMYYAMKQYLPAGVAYAIFCFGNPVVWYTGLAGLATTLIIWVSRHLYTTENKIGCFHWESKDANVNTAFVLIGFLAQFLPWVLVPRGTYIYHYFASIPFLCFGTVLAVEKIYAKRIRLGKIVIGLLVAVSLVAFVAFYPYASGVTVPVGWLDFMKQFLRIYY